jgi:uncharacterized protein (DUF433 family)
MSVAIIDNRIPGTRISVFDVYLYYRAGKSVSEIAEVLPLTADQIEEAIRYIDANRETVEAVHQRIEERNARGNSPEVEEKARQARQKMEAWLAERRRSRATEVNGASDPGGRE